MRFKNQHKTAKIPTIDLIPMLTVMMGVLGFFVITATLISAPPDRVEVTVPNEEDPQNVTGSQRNQPLIIRLQSDDQAQIEDLQFNKQAILNEVAAFINTNTEAPVVLVSEPQVPYNSVVQWLTAMRQVGGDRVSLGIDPGQPAPTPSNAKPGDDTKAINTAAENPATTDTDQDDAD